MKYLLFLFLGYSSIGQAITKTDDGCSVPTKKQIQCLDNLTNKTNLKRTTEEICQWTFHHKAPCDELTIEQVEKFLRMKCNIKECK